MGSCAQYYGDTFWLSSRPVVEKIWAQLRSVSGISEESRSIFGWCLEESKYAYIGSIVELGQFVLASITSHIQVAS